MQLTFMDREGERSRLARAFARREGSFCCLYGRRRCGKSRLLLEALPKRGSVYYVGDERASNLQRTALAAAIASLLPGFDRVAYPDWSSLLTRWWREAPPGAVLAIDEFPRLVEESRDLPSIVQNLLDAHRTKAVHLAIAGSSQRMMQGLVLDANAPLYGRAREIMRVVPLGAAWIGKALRLSDPIRCLEAYALWGGIPRYWELAGEYDTTWAAAEDLVFDPLGVLHTEPRRLLMDDLRDTAQAMSILSLIGRGSRRLSEIAARLGQPATSLSRPLFRLTDLGLVRRDRPFGAPEKNAKKSLYRIDDPFLAFWFRYIDPNRSRLEAGGARDVARETAGHVLDHYGDIWEGLARQAVARLRIAGIAWGPSSRWWGGGTDGAPLEIDIVAESSDGNDLLLGEAKLRIDATGLARARKDLHAKASRFPLAGKYRRVVETIFAAAGPASRGNDVIAAREVFRSLT